jgi:predicted nucleic acid-binding protein
MSLFVDTSVWYAAADRADSGNGRAKEVLSAGESLVTTDHVLVETWTLLRHRIHVAAAEAFWTGLRGGAARIEPVGPADLEAAWTIGRDFPDQAFSIVDRTSFAVMERLGVHRAASFDGDFAVYRFGPRRSRAFEVVR